MYTSEAPRNTMARNPSHLGSNRKLPAGGSACSSLASIGSIGGAMGKLFLTRRDVVIQMKYTAGIHGSAGPRVLHGQRTPALAVVLQRCAVTRACACDGGRRNVWHHRWHHGSRLPGDVTEAKEDRRQARPDTRQPMFLHFSSRRRPC